MTVKHFLYCTLHLYFRIYFFYCKTVTLYHLGLCVTLYFFFGLKNAQNVRNFMLTFAFTVRILYENICVPLMPLCIPPLMSSVLVTLMLVLSMMFSQ